MVVETVLGFGYSILMADLAQGDNSVTRKMLGEGARFVGAEALKSAFFGPAGNFTYDKAKEFYARFRKGDEKNLNHDLQRAARKAQLTATLLAVRACLQEFERFENGKTLIWSQASIQNWSDKDKIRLKALADNLEKKLKELPKAPAPPSPIEQTEIIRLFDPKENINSDEAQKQLVTRLKRITIGEFAGADIPEHAAKLLTEAIETGWNETEKPQAFASSSLYPLGLRQNLINAEKEFDWFSLLCGLFNEEYKNNPQVEAAMQKYLLLDIRSSQAGATIDPKIISDIFAGHFAQLGDSFLRLEILLEKIEVKQDAILGFVKDFIEENRRLHRQTQQVIVARVDNFEENVKQILAKVATTEKLQQLQEAIEGQRQANIRQAQERYLPKPVSGWKPQPNLMFVNRDKQRRDLREQMRNGGFPVIVVKGSGGYGKTALITDFLNETASRAEITEPNLNGLIYCYCDAEKGDTKTLYDILSRAEPVAAQADGRQETLVALHARYTKNEITLPALIQRFYEDLAALGTIWLALDNFEDLMSGHEIADAEIRELFEHARHYADAIKILVTTRNEPVFDGCEHPDFEPIALSEGLPVEDAIDYLRAAGKKAGMDTESDGVLRDFVEYVHRIPAALVSVIKYLTQISRMTLAELMNPQNKHLLAGFHEYDLQKGLRSLIAEQFGQQSPEERLMASVLSVFREPVPLAALQLALPSLDWHKWRLRLEHNTLFDIDRSAGLYDLTRGVREYVYEQIPTENDSDSSFTRAALHMLTADYYKQTRLPLEQCKMLADFKPQFEEMHHYYEAKMYSKAATAIIGDEDLTVRRLGHARLLIQERLKLIGKPMSSFARASNIGNLGVAYLDIGELRKAIFYSLEALRTFKEIKALKNAGVSLYNIGIAYKNLRNPEMALKYHERALEIFRTIKDIEEEATVLINIGNVFLLEGDLPKSMEYYEQALSISEKNKDKRNLSANVHSNIGTALSISNSYHEALGYYESALKHYQDSGYKVFEGRILGAIGRIKFNLGEKAKGIKLVEQALEIARTVEDEMAKESWSKTLEWMKSS
ncbi:MAG TPA: tetratricopeptide repeat protein [Pyrinomonadaceae bacterium]